MRCLSVGPTQQTLRILRLLGSVHTAPANGAYRISPRRTGRPASDISISDGVKLTSRHIYFMMD